MQNSSPGAAAASSSEESEKESWNKKGCVWESAEEGGKMQIDYEHTYIKFDLCELQIEFIFSLLVWLIFCH